MRIFCAWLAVLVMVSLPAYAQKPATPKKPADKKAETPKKKGDTAKKTAKKKAPLPKPTHAYVGATIFTGKSGAAGRIVDGVILVGGGKIIAAGTKAKVKIPPGVETIDLKGKVVVPGLIDAQSRLFLSGREGTGRGLHEKLVDGLDLYDRRAKAALARGVTAVHVGPRGSQFGGQGAVVKLSADGARTGKVAMPTQTATATYTRHAGSATTPAQHLTVFDRYKTRFEQAEDYKDLWDKYAKKLKKYEKDLAAWKKKKAAYDKAMAAYNKAVEAAKKAAKGGKSGNSKRTPPKRTPPKKGDPKKDPPKKEDPKKDPPKKEDPKKDPPKKDPPKKDPPKKSDPEDQPKKDPPKKGDPKKPDTKKPVAKKPGPKKPGPKKPAAPKKPAPLAKEPTKPKEPKKDPKKDVLKDVLEGKKALLMEVGISEDIESALKLAADFKIKLTFTGATEAYAHTEKIRKGKHNVILGPPAGPDVSDVGRMKRRADAAAVLSNAGIKTAIASPGTTGRESRYMRYYAIRAMAHGTQPTQALAAVTLNAATAIGAEKRIGSLEKGKDADFVVLSGAFSDLGSKVLQVYIDGKQAYRRTK